MWFKNDLYAIRKWIKNLILACLLTFKEYLDNILLFFLNEVQGTLPDTCLTCLWKGAHTITYILLFSLSIKSKDVAAASICNRKLSIVKWWRRLRGFIFQLLRYIESSEIISGEWAYHTEHYFAYCISLPHQITFQLENRRLTFFIKALIGFGFKSAPIWFLFKWKIKTSQILRYNFCFRTLKGIYI